MINMFLHGCSDHRDQLFCLFELKKASLALRIESRFEKSFSMGINCMSLAVWLGDDRKCSAAQMKANTNIDQYRPFKSKYFIK